ncbi:SusC/RagA family TonB-linked outer membrane protein [Robertkochia solimangrovi]|uniref:SusC/RagA family TonB-linked outer membrane protein n=1 Tax=Robertkochia solimangrovi TaxID=2213046 RepID=UPI00118066B4|nr:SusC/RagA family TonB-linked outer membrane protein [Robertkochia solimangrovi]TRZ43196.1 SusC/RagA family TonB-linked outer membrane protein [Robertkochia solimangrovi]
MRKRKSHFLRWGLLFLFLHCSTFIYSQTKTYNLDLQDAPLSKLIEEIRQNSDYKIIYNSEKIDVTTRISVSVQNASIREVFSKALSDTNLSYKISGNQIILLVKPATTIQEREINGTVLDDLYGQPLAGVAIMINGTAKGSITNFDGNFKYLVRSSDLENVELKISYIGMETMIIPMGDKSVFNIRMKESVNELDQVVVTSSYGTTKLKEEVVGSIASINSRDIATEQATESVDKALEGQLAGVLIENTSGVGGPVKINIRGQGSLSPIGNQNLGTSTQPLIIIDGVTITEEMAIDNSFFDASGSFAENLNNPLAQIAADDIESISVLKDAAAASIYGADGANGVIIITTKKGKTSKPKFNLSAQTGISEAINQIKYLNGAQYTELRNAYLINTGQNPISYNGVDTDWFDLMNNTGVYQKYNFSVSGAQKKFNYRSSLTYTNLDEPQVGNGSEQLNMNISLGYTSGAFSTSLKLNPSYIQRNNPNIYYNYAFLPTIAPYDEDGNYSDIGVSGLANPLAAAEQNLNRTETYGILGSFQAAFKINEDLEISSLFGIDHKDKEQDRYFSAQNESGRYNGNFVLNGVEYPSWGRRIINQRNSTRWNWQSQVRYNKKFGQHKFDLLAGFEMSEEKTDFNYASGRGFTNPYVVNNVIDAIQDNDPDTEADETNTNQTYDSDINYNSRVSLYSQLNYDLKGKYFALVNFRRDESSVFGDDTNVAYNGGAGLSWILSKEAFLENSSWIDFLKLKVSYGTTGNSRIGSYRSKGLYQTAVSGYNGLDEATPYAAPNPRLTWERNTKFNTGVDINLFDRLSLNLEYYYDNIEDLITSRDIPTETGYSSLQLNAASMYNKGFEATVNMKLIRKENFNWTASFNLATLTSEVTSLTGLGSDYSTATAALAQKIGYSTSTIWGVKWAGIDPATGRDLIDVNGQIYDAATYNQLHTEEDWQPLGDSQPDVYGGFNTRFQIFKNLLIAVRGSYQFGSEYLVSNSLISQYNVTYNRNLSVNAFDYWRNSGDNVLQPIPANNPVISNLSKFVYDDSYIRISNINLSYQIPLPENSFLDTFSIFTDISNVAYWYMDEAPKGLNGIREFRFSYPQARTISCGIKTSF